jgi:hypothetical protein
MRSLKIFSLLALAATTMVVFTSSVSAATPTSPAGTTYEGKLHATSESHLTITNAITNINCNSTLEGEVEPSGSGEPIGVPLSSLSFTGCTDSWHVTVTSPGTLELHGIPGSKNGTVTWSGAKIQTTRFSVPCNYATSAADVGTLTGSKTTGGTATIDLSGQLVLESGNSEVCGKASGALTGSLSVATPDYLDVDA